MRKLILAAGLILFAAPAFAQKTDASGNDAILRRLEAIEKTQEEIAERLTRIEAKLANAPESRAMPDFKERGADLEALAKIKLPDNPTKEQVREYVQEIANASRRQNSFTDRDPQIEMLTRVGPANVDVLLDALRADKHGFQVMDTYLLPAIEELAGNEHKEMILKRLPQEQQLAEVVLEKGWSGDARSILVAGLQARSLHLPYDWIKAVASFRDPATYDLLKWYLANGDSPSMTYETIKDLPGIELSQEVAESWERLKNEGQSWEIQSMARIAMEYGHLDALEKEIELLDSDELRHFGSDMGPRRLILRYTDAHGTVDEIRKWYQENKDRLVFDKAAKKFVVKKEQ